MPVSTYLRLIGDVVFTGCLYCVGVLLDIMRTRPAGALLGTSLPSMGVPRCIVGVLSHIIVKPEFVTS